MRVSGKILVLLSLLALRPACGGGGSGGTAGVFPISLPAVVPNLPLDATPTTQTINVASLTDAQVQTALQAALNLPAPGKIVLTTGGGAVQRTVVLTAELNLPSNVGSPKSAILDGSDQITLSGGLSVRILNLQDQAQLTVQRMKFVDGRATDSGGAINNDFTVRQVKLINCTFTNCDTTTTGPDEGGGAIRIWNGEHTQISNCTFTDCSASNGGAVNSLGTRLTIINSTFTTNAAFGTGGGGNVGGSGGIGGAVYVDNVSNDPSALHQLSITGCTFTSNTANDHAGAVFGFTSPTFPSTTIVDRCTFASNSVTDTAAHSGAFYSQNGTLHLTNSTFNSNTATGNGGAMRSLNGVANITNCTFHANTAGNLGGGLFISSGVVTLTNLTISQNHGQEFAGGIFSNGTTSTTINNCILHANTATVNPNGGIQINNSFSGQGNLQSPDAPLPGGKPATSTGTMKVADSMLGSLQNNGGPTQTRLPNLGSPAIDLPGSSSAPIADQRGNARNGPADAGAAER